MIFMSECSNIRHHTEASKLQLVQNNAARIVLQVPSRYWRRCNGCRWSQWHHIQTGCADNLTLKIGQTSALYSIYCIWVNTSWI